MKYLEESDIDDIVEFIKSKPFTSKGEGCRYYDIPISFDTESTSFTLPNGEHGAYCYIWMIAFAPDKIYYGRYLEGFAKFCDKLSKKLRLRKERRLLFFRKLFRA